MENKKYISRKTLLYKTGVEYGNYSLNHALGCSHGCRYPCYAMLMAKRFGKVKNYNEWINPGIVENSLELLEHEIRRYKKNIKFVHLCFTTDPFMFKNKNMIDLSLKIIDKLNEYKIKCTALTKGILPCELSATSKENEYGISLVSLNKVFRMDYEPFSASCEDRIESLFFLHKRGYKTWASIEPYPTPNIVNQDIDDILESVSFVDKIIFGKLNYNTKVLKYKNHIHYYNYLSQRIIDFCKANNKEYHIKDGTIRTGEYLSNEDKNNSVLLNV
jgi:DNA repair photolyase